DFGDPTIGTDYTFCVLDGAGTLQLAATTPADPCADDELCWRSTAADAYGYSTVPRVYGVPGLTRIALKAGAAGHATIRTLGGLGRASVRTRPCGGHFRSERGGRVGGTDRVDPDPAAPHRGGRGVAGQSRYDARVDARADGGRCDQRGGVEGAAGTLGRAGGRDPSPRGSPDGHRRRTGAPGPGHHRSRGVRGHAARRVGAAQLRRARAIGAALDRGRTITP